MDNHTPIYIYINIKYMNQYNIRLFCPMLLDFPDTFFGNCAPHKLPLSQ